MQRKLCEFSRNDGFTLAEVLITLVIIGVIAAITVPTMINKFAKEKASSQVKKAYSEINQAIKLSQVDNGNMNSWDWSIVETNSRDNNKKFIDKYLIKYMRAKYCEKDTDNLCKIGGITDNDVRYFLDNGTMLVFYPTSNKNIGFIFVTSSKLGTNKIVMGRDRFYFSITNDKVLPDGFIPGHTRDELLTSGINARGYTYSCKKDNGGDNNNLHRHGCTWLLYLDGWQFKDDYPW